jgi:homospermidine synthase
VKVRGWTPLEGPYHGFAVTHNETISIADFLTLRDGSGKVGLRSATTRAMRPC